MGLLSWFGKGPFSEAKINKITKLATNPFAQTDVRTNEMLRLLHDGSDLALRGVLKRFAVNANGHIADEDEKKWLEDRLVDMGEGVLPALGDYIRSQEQLTYALRAYLRIAGRETAVQFFLSVLKSYGPDDYRSSDAKVQLLWQLADELSAPHVLSTLVPFLTDHSDEVRWVVMDLITRAHSETWLTPAILEDIVRYLAEVVTHKETAPRILRRACELLAEHEWQLPETHLELAPLMEEEFFVDKKHFVRRRSKKRTDDQR